MSSRRKRVRETLRSLISALPGGKLTLRRYRYYRKKLDLSRIADAREIFHHYYASNTWGSGESLSGPGSTIRYTENIRREIPRLVSELGVKVILDAPCGDYNWFKEIAWREEIIYIGGDIVGPLVERNQLLYGRPNARFINLNIVHDSLPRADLWHCRDCLFHLSNHDIFSAINNLLRSNIRYLLTTTHSNYENSDIPTGAFRLLNLQKPPFSFGKPIALIDDWVEGCAVSHLALWEREALRNVLASNKTFQRAGGLRL